jgi:cAMP-dependent protein kinase regulator
MQWRKKFFSKLVIFIRPNEFVIKQGEQGDCIYVVEQGELECYKKYKEKDHPKLVKTYFAGDSFGELALFYNAPRSATIKTRTNCILWSLDRETFNNIVKQASMYLNKIKSEQRDKNSKDFSNLLKSYPQLNLMNSLKSVTR